MAHIFHGRTNHVCTLVGRAYSKSYLPSLTTSPNVRKKIARFFKRWILVAESNPHSVYFYRDSASIIDARRFQAKSSAWIIHPFSMFRLYYEMWMTVIFFTCLVHMPLYSSYNYLLGAKLRVLHFILCVFCLVDVIINFRTGRCISNERIKMKPAEIARDYIFGPYFICDVLSSVPDTTDLHNNSKVAQIVSFFCLLKIVRLKTFLKYLERTCTYFRVEGFMCVLIKLAIIGLLIVHYVTCFYYFVDLAHGFLEGANSSAIGPKRDNFTEFVRLYSRNCYLSGSMILDADSSVSFAESRIKLLFEIFGYIFGKAFVTFLTVVLLDVLKLRNLLEVNYFAMINQVKDFMSGRHAPLAFQERVAKIYYYQHHGKMINMTRINRYISDKLKREIKYHDCRKLIHSVKIFESLPREIIENILPHLRKEIFLAKDTIVQAGTSGYCMYFVEAGTVAVFSPSGKEICHLQDGEYFGEYCLLGPTLKRNATVVALETCELYKLERRAFKKCVEDHPDVYKHLLQESKKRHLQTTKIEKTV